MEEAEARRLQPHFIRSFFLEAFRLLGGQISQRETGRYEITHVPAEVRAQEQAIGADASHRLRRYERVTFEKELVSPTGQPQAQLLAPGHPLLDATVDLVLERYRPLLQAGRGARRRRRRARGAARARLRGARDPEPAREPDGERQVVSRRLQFVELTATGTSRWLVTRHTSTTARSSPTSLSWSSGSSTRSGCRGVEDRGLDYAITTRVPSTSRRCERHTLERVELHEGGGHRRLTSEIAYWDHRAEELKSTGACRQEAAA